MIKISELLLEWSIAHLRKAGTNDLLMGDFAWFRTTARRQKDPAAAKGKGGSRGPRKIYNPESFILEARPGA
jgi:hypothetical protein